MRINSILNLLVLGNFAVGMAAFVVIGLMTPIADGFNLSRADTGIILTSYAVALPEQRGRAMARVFAGITLAQVVGVPLGAWLGYRSAGKPHS